MFWWAVAPFLITLAIFTVMVVGSTMIAEGFRRKLLVFSITFVLATLAFVPSCYTTMFVLDQFRFGTFTYGEYGDIVYFHGKHYLPSSAKDILLITDGGGFDAKYKISRAELDQFISAFLSENPGYDQLMNFEAEYPELNREYFEHDFRYLGWIAPEDLVRFEPIIRSNGAGFHLWYSEAEQTAYQQATYW